MKPTSHERYIEFYVFDRKSKHPQCMQELIANHQSPLRKLIENYFENHLTWKYEGRAEVAVFLRSNQEISLRSDINQANGHRKNEKNLLFNLRMTDEEYKAHLPEIVDACNGIAEALLPYRKEKCFYPPAPYWEIVTRKGYS